MIVLLSLELLVQCVNINRFDMYILRLLRCSMLYKINFNNCVRLMRISVESFVKGLTGNISVYNDYNK